MPPEVLTKRTLSGPVALARAAVVEAMSRASSWPPRDWPTLCRMGMWPVCRAHCSGSVYTEVRSPNRLLLVLHPKEALLILFAKRFRGYLSLSLYM